MKISAPSRPGPGSRKVLAWSVHLLTASGALWGILAIIAAVNRDWLPFFIWMGLASLIDGLDGTFARAAQVKRVLPNFDGALLDNIVDYLNYVIVPALFLYLANLMPAGFEFVGGAVIALTSAYQFSQGDAKTDDDFFKGFPSYWNVVVMYLFLLNPSPWLNLAVIVTCGILVFVPIKYIYPSRTRPFRKLTLTLSGLWSVAIVIVFFNFDNPPLGLVKLSLLFIAYYIGISLYLHFREKHSPVMRHA